MNGIQRAALTVLLTFCAASALAEGYRTTVSDSGRDIAVCVVRGSAYEMGRSLGELMRPEAVELTARVLETLRASGDADLSNEALDRAWKACEPHMSENFREELRGLAEGSGISLESLRRVHALPLVAEYSCSSIAVWGRATRSGDLFLTRNLDWNMGLRAHDYPCLVLYLPDQGVAHLNVTFAGYIGCNTGMNAAGVALSEIGDSPARDKPYDLDGLHFTMLFRDMLYGARTLDGALDILKKARRIKKYHYVFGSGAEKKAVKIKAHAPNLEIWSDNDPKDELAPRTLKDVVYQDEGRGAFPFLKRDYGRHDENTIIAISKAIPIKGDNVLDAVYNATNFELWISYARGATEAYTLPYTHIDLKAYLDFDKPVGKVVRRSDETSKAVQR